MIEEFFREIDSNWPAEAGRIELRLIGCGALLLQTDYVRGTKDGDVLETTDLGSDAKQRLLALAGRGTAIHRRRNIFIDIVANGLPFLPHVPLWHPALGLNRTLVRLEVQMLDVTDVIVSKLKRFHANDRSDIDAMVSRGLVCHPQLLERFRSAVDVFSCDARASDLPAVVEHLHIVERDMLGVDETDIELPSWI